MLTVFLWRFSHCKLPFLYALKAAWGYLTMQELPSAGQAENGLCPQFITTPLWLNLEMDLSKGDGATASWACLRDRSMCILFQLTLEKEGKNCRGADEFGDPWCWMVKYTMVNCWERDGSLLFNFLLGRTRLLGNGASPLSSPPAVSAVRSQVSFCPDLRFLVQC